MSVISAALCFSMGAACAQEAAPQQDAAPVELEDENAADLLTQAELETLMAPVALYPDTLLIQILVAATYPLEIVKADRFVAANADSDPETLQTSIEAEGWDPSVAVLATAFPDVLADMAVHVEWTDAVGTAMLAQSDDVLNAVQTLRNQAIETGALISGEAQTVETDEEENVVITPADPEVVYVPDYDPQVVYDNSLSDALVTSAMVFTSFVVIDAIFDDDDDWNNYWGCRNCGGWGGGPIYRNPDIDIDIDGDVNIGNRIDRDTAVSNVGNRGDGGWSPDAARQSEARDKIASKRNDSGASKLPLDKATSRPAASRGDALRGDLAARSGASDISHPANRAALPQVDRPSTGANSGRLPQVDRPSNRPSADKAAAVKKTANRPAAAKKKPAVKKPATQKVAAKKRAAPQKSAVKKRSGANRAKAAGNRGKAGKLKGRR